MDLLEAPGLHGGGCIRADHVRHGFKTQLQDRLKQARLLKASAHYHDFPGEDAFLQILLAGGIGHFAQPAHTPRTLKSFGELTLHNGPERAISSSCAGAGLPRFATIAQGLAFAVLRASWRTVMMPSAGRATTIVPFEVIGGSSRPVSLAVV